MLRYALSRAGRSEVPETDRHMVEDALLRLGRGLGLKFDGAGA